MRTNSSESGSGVAKSAAKKPAARKSAAKKTAAKKTAVERNATRTAAKTGAGGKRTRTPGEATLHKQQAKLEEERAQYLAKIEANERRLRDERTATGQPLTPEQLNVTNDILRRQRERLAELDAYERSRLADGDPR